MADKAASEAGRALVAIRWARASKAARRAQGKLMVDAREARRGKRKTLEAEEESQSGAKSARSQRAK